MSLLDETRKTFVLMEKTRVSDGEGGSTITWTAGLEFGASIKNDTSTLAQLADQQGDVSTYTILFPKSIQLAEMDYIKRKSDNDIFKITSDPAEVETPSVSGLNLKMARAEKIRGGLPT